MVERQGVSHGIDLLLLGVVGLLFVCRSKDDGLISVRVRLGPRVLYSARLPKDAIVERYRLGGPGLYVVDGEYGPLWVRGVGPVEVVGVRRRLGWRAGSGFVVPLKDGPGGQSAKHQGV